MKTVDFSRIWKICFFFCRAIVEIPILLLVFGYCKVTGYKIYVIRADRIGHFIPDAAEAVIRRSIDPGDLKSFYIFGSKPVNAQWAKMVKESLPMLEWTPYRDAYKSRMTFLNSVFLNATKTSSRDITSNYYKYDCAQLKFSDHENAVGFNWLKKRGLRPDTKFICLLIRDQKYLSSLPCNKNTDFGYHSYRNSEIATYLKAIESLIGRGYVVIRVGREVEKSLELESNAYIEYCNDPDQSDFLDIWLAAKCTAMISTGTGHDVLASLYRRPLLLVNFLPLISIHAFHEILAVPKKLCWAKSGRLLNLDDYLSACYFSSEEYVKAGIKITNLTCDELMFAVEEFANFLERGGDKIIDHSDQAKFWQVFKRHPLFIGYHAILHSGARISELWLGKYSKQLFD